MWKNGVTIIYRYTHSQHEGDRQDEMALHSTPTGIESTQLDDDDVMI